LPCPIVRPPGVGNGATFWPGAITIAELGARNPVRVIVPLR
jgi:hypothetical protein